MVAEPSPPALAAGLLPFFLLTYTAWDKHERRLSLCNLKDVVLVRRGPAHSLMELYKIIALMGLAMLAICYFLEDSYAHAKLAFWSQVAHSLYSLWKYYGDKVPSLQGYPTMLSELLDAKRKRRRLVGLKRISILFGTSSLMLLAVQQFFAALELSVLVSAAILFTGLMHFVLMEIDYKFVLQVRTTGNAIVPLTILSVIALCLQWLWITNDNDHDHTIR